MRGIKQKVGWSGADNTRLLRMMQEGYSLAEIARQLGKSVATVDGHYKNLISARAQPKTVEDTTGKYIIKKTDFACGKVTVFAVVDIRMYSNSTRAWNAAMNIIRKANASRGKNPCFYWLKYK